MSVDAATGAAGAPGSTPADALPRLSGSRGTTEGTAGGEAPDGSAGPGDGDDGRDGLREAARRLEGVFVQKLFQAMRSTVPDGGYLDSGRGEEMFRGLMDRHLAEEAAERMDRGLADALYRQLRGAVEGEKNAVEGETDVSSADTEKTRSGGQP